MGHLITFNVTCKGASHIKSGKPCQDFSLSWKSDNGDILVAIVCDGHGGDTYVRSDRGSKLAAEIALYNIKHMVETVSPQLFLEREGAVTARPENEDDIFHKQRQIHQKTSVNEDDIQSQQERQDNAFYEAVTPIRDIDQEMQRLFACIYTQWTLAIEEDAKNNPFTDWENSQLNGMRITKAYGTTLMAFVRTPLYWFAFHIGDGKMLCCDANLNWREPVPWDCNCFLNITTSLCLREPLHSFRYAFNGKGEFPAAVIMGSDGLDDSWCTMDNLKNFYSSSLSIFNDLKEEETIKEMREYLPRLSEKGSRDDMSMAGIIDMDMIVNSVSIYKKQKELNSIFKIRREHEEKIAKLKQQLMMAEQSYSHICEDLLKEEQKSHKWLEQLNIIKTRIEEIHIQLERITTQKENAQVQLNEARQSFLDWFSAAKIQKNAIEVEKGEIIAQGEEIMKKELNNWEEKKNAFIANEEANKAIPVDVIIEN